MKTNSVDLLDLTTAESPWRSWLLRSWIIGSVLLTSFCVFRGLEASAPKPLTTRQITITEEVRRTKRMDEVQENDYVVARDGHGTEIGPRRVTKVFRRTSDHLRLLTLEARDGTRQTIKTTDEHPFGCADSLHFIPAGQLPLGHQVPGPKGELQTLVASVREEHPEGIPVFNFEVEGFHTYFVGSLIGKSILVHNTCDVDMHHTIPREIRAPRGGGPGWLPEDLANHPDIVGRPGNPNRWPVPRDLHRDIHRPSRPNGSYNERWKEELEDLAGRIDPEDWTVDDILDIRRLLTEEFGIDGFAP
jgi:hypothetical protein